MIFISLVVLIFTFIVWYQNKYRYRNQLLSKIPSPKKYPLIHNMLEFYGKSPVQLFEWIEEKSLLLGPVYQFTLEPFEDSTIMVSDAKVAEGILSSQKLIDKGDDYELMKAWLGTGLLISTGKKWHSRRKIITPAFHFQILEKFVEIMDEQGKVFIKKLEKYDGQEVDVFPLANLYALDVICESAMGCKIEAQIKDSEYVRAVKQIAKIVFERSFDALRRNAFLYQFTEMYQREKKTLKVLHGFTDSVIRLRREELLVKNESEVAVESSGIRRKMALLDLLLQATIEGAPLSNTDIREEVDTFMFEGHDTTTSGISFCLYNIAKNPEVQQKIFDEIHNEIGQGGEALTLQLLNNLHYLELVIKESLRLFPSVPLFARKLSEETTVGGYTFPKGSQVFISAYLMGRNPKIFPDPLDFKPERFDAETTAEKMNPFAYVPFSAGPRNCIGQKFAIYEMKSIICNIVRNYRLTISKENEKLSIFSDLVIKSANGIILGIHKRE